MCIATPSMSVLWGHGLLWEAMTVVEFCRNEGKKWLGAESDIHARRTGCDRSEKEVIKGLRKGLPT